MADPAKEIAAIKALGLSDEVTEGILGGNFARLMGIDPEAPVPGPVEEPA
jgi:predicted TIM-barrel fold metal-dependent hydrolase